jgi:hypothetical protein
MTPQPASLFCATCGAAGQQMKAYCKRCGAWLPDIKKTRSRSWGGDTPQQNLFTTLFMSALSAVVALFSGIALYATYLGTDEAKWSIYLAAGFCMCIAGWQASSFIAALKLRRRFGRVIENTQGQVSAHRPVAAVGPADTKSFIVPSITEGTTELLEPVPREQMNGCEWDRVKRRERPNEQ